MGLFVMVYPYLFSDAEKSLRCQQRNKMVDKDSNYFIRVLSRSGCVLCISKKPGCNSKSGEGEG